MKKIILSVPKPCHENWEQMTPRDRGRFCASCQKTVVDFSTMSDRQIAEFFERPVNSVCGHFSQDQLDRDIDMARKRIPWMKYFFQISLPALLLSAKATAQGQVTTKGDTVSVISDEKRTPTKIAASKRNIAEGKVVDPNGYPIPSATVVIKGTEVGTAVDDTGYFRLMVKPNVILRVSSIGFEPKEIRIGEFSDKAKTIVLVELSSWTTGEYYIVSKPRKKKKEVVPIVQKTIDTACKNFKVYPNPATNNSHLKIDLSELETGEFVISLINAEGEVLQTEEIRLSEKNRIVDFYLKDLFAGMYIIHVFNRKTAASWSEQIIVQ